MVSNYMTKFVGKYRVLPELDIQTHDVPRDVYGNICDGYDDLYIPCKGGAKIFYYGMGENKSAILSAYFPKKNTIYREIKNKITTSCGWDFEESQEEGLFKFFAENIDEIAKIMGAHTRGANISPFSIRNLPMSKNVVIDGKMLEQYKKIVDCIPQSDLLIVSRITNDFIEKVIVKQFDGKDKQLECKKEMKRLCLYRQPKEYIYYKGEFENYLEYLRSEIKKIYHNTP